MSTEGSGRLLSCCYMSPRVQMGSIYRVPSAHLQALIGAVWAAFGLFVSFDPLPHVSWTVGRRMGARGNLRGARQRTTARSKSPELLTSPAPSGRTGSRAWL